MKNNVVAKDSERQVIQVDEKVPFLKGLPIITSASICNVWCFSFGTILIQPSSR